MNVMLNETSQPQKDKYCIFSGKWSRDLNTHTHNVTNKEGTGDLAFLQHPFLQKTGV